LTKEVLFSKRNQRWFNWIASA